MFKTLLYTEFTANKKFLVLAAIANLVLFFIIAGQKVETFIAGTSLVFYIQLIVMGVTNSDQHRDRLYAQLPVTATERFLAGWLFVLVWLGLQTLTWVLFGLAWDGGFGVERLPEILGVAVGVATLLAIVSIGIDLGNFTPPWIRWVYVAALLLLLGLAIHFQVSIGILHMDGEVSLFPYALLETANGNNPAGWSLAIASFIVLLVADFLVYRYSDHYLN